MRIAAVHARIFWQFGWLRARECFTRPQPNSITRSRSASKAKFGQQSIVPANHGTTALFPGHETRWKQIGYSESWPQAGPSARPLQKEFSVTEQPKPVRPKKKQNNQNAVKHGASRASLCCPEKSDVTTTRCAQTCMTSGHPTA